MNNDLLRGLNVIPTREFDMLIALHDRKAISTSELRAIVGIKEPPK